MAFSSILRRLASKLKSKLHHTNKHKLRKSKPQRNPSSHPVPAHSAYRTTTRTLGGTANVFETTADQYTNGPHSVHIRNIIDDVGFCPQSRHGEVSDVTEYETRISDLTSDSEDDSSPEDSPSRLSYEDDAAEDRFQVQPCPGSNIEPLWLRVRAPRRCGHARVASVESTYCRMAVSPKNGEWDASTVSYCARECWLKFGVRQRNCESYRVSSVIWFGVDQRDFVLVEC